MSRAIVRTVAALILLATPLVVEAQQAAKKLPGGVRGIYWEARAVVKCRVGRASSRPSTRVTSAAPCTVHGVRSQTLPTSCVRECAIPAGKNVARQPYSVQVLQDAAN